MKWAQKGIRRIGLDGGNILDRKIQVPGRTKSEERQDTGKETNVVSRFGNAYQLFPCK